MGTKSHDERTHALVDQVTYDIGCVPVFTDEGRVVNAFQARSLVQQVLGKLDAANKRIAELEALVESQELARANRARDSARIYDVLEEVKAERDAANAAYEMVCEAIMPGMRNGSAAAMSMSAKLLHRRAEKLRAALRSVAIDDRPALMHGCRLCDGAWNYRDDENHDPDCLAKPETTEEK